MYTNKGIGGVGLNTVRPYQPDTWHEITERVELLDDPEHPDRFTMWVDGVQVLDGTLTGQSALYWDETNGLGQVYLLTYHTNKDPTQEHPTGSVWYDDLVVSTEPIAMREAQ